MVPSAELRPQVFPSERLLANGLARPQLRAELRQIANVRNAGSVLSLWVVTRRSWLASSPPCSAMARSRLITRHWVIHGSHHNRG